LKAIIGIWNYPDTKEVSDTIREVALLLLNKYPFADIIKPYDVSKESSVIPAAGDFQVRLSIKNVAVYIDSKIYSHIKEPIDERLSDCQLAVCATRHQGKTTDDLENASGFKLIWTTPYVVDSDSNQRYQQDKLNHLKAQHILDMVEQLGILS
jgi:hypothetical protein